MRILTKYLLKLHLIPFVFALVATTGFLLIQQIARRFGELVGKGLPATWIAEVFALSLPFLLAMTVPMAVLISVLYTFNRLTADNEVTALRAGGVSLGRIVWPVLSASIVVAAASFLFSDHVLPRTNHRLRTLLVDIQRKKPTFSLKEQVINEVQRNRVFLRAATIDQGTFRMRDVTIYDLADQDRKRVIYADSGQMALTEDLTDLHLTLYDGTMHELNRSEPGVFQQTDFEVDFIRVAGVGNELQRTVNDTFKGDREMGVCEMEGVIGTSTREAAQAERQAEMIEQNGLRSLVGLAPLPIDSLPESTTGSVYCRVLAAVASWIVPDNLEAQQGGEELEEEGLLDRFNETAKLAFSTGKVPRPRMSEVRSLRDRARSARTRAASFSVELQKKYSISAACIVFVLIGVPVAIRFPKGGIGLVIGTSFVILTVFYVGLIGGEALADKRVVGPFWAMWTPNVLFSAIGLVMLYRIRTAATTVRGGGLVDTFQSKLVSRRGRFAR